MCRTRDVEKVQGKHFLNNLLVIPDAAEPRSGMCRSAPCTRPRRSRPMVAGPRAKPSWKRASGAIHPGYNACARNVSQALMSPDWKPVLNHFTRCAEVPWVKESGTTVPCASRSSVSSPICDAAVRALHRRTALGELPFHVHDPELVLHVVADLVRDHVGAREVAVGTETRRQFPEEIEIEVHALVTRAVERPHRGRRAAAGGADLAVEQHQPGIDVLLAHLLEVPGPHVLGAAEDLADELYLRIAAIDLRGLRGCAGRRHRSAAGEQPEDDPARGRKDDRDDDRNDGAAEAKVYRPDAEAAATAAGRLFHVVAGTAFLPEHDVLLSPR